MLPDFIINPALRMSGVVSGIAIAAAFPRERLKQSLDLGQLSEPKIEDAGAMPVHQHHSQTRRCAQQMSDGLEMEMTIDEEPRGGNIRGQFVFLPYILCRASEYRLGMSSIAAQLSREAPHSFEVSANTFLLCLALWSLSVLQAMKGVSQQILDQDCVLFMRPVFRRCRLKIECRRTAVIILKFSQSSNLFTRNAHERISQGNLIWIKRRRKRQAVLETAARGSEFCAGGPALS